MGCDYYIIKQLTIEHLNDDDDIVIHTIELSRKRCYFVYTEDSSESDYSESNSETYSERYNRKYQHYLHVSYVPNTLFDNNRWKNKQIEEKYRDIIASEIPIYNGSLVKVIKEEKRYFR